MTSPREYLRPTRRERLSTNLTIVYEENTGPLREWWGRVGEARGRWWNGSAGDESNGSNENENENGNGDSRAENRGEGDEETKGMRRFWENAWGRAGKFRGIVGSRAKRVWEGAGGFFQSFPTSASSPSTTAATTTISSSPDETTEKLIRLLEALPYLVFWLFFLITFVALAVGVREKVDGALVAILGVGYVVLGLWWVGRWACAWMRKKRGGGGGGGGDVERGAEVGDGVEVHPTGDSRASTDRGAGGWEGREARPPAQDRQRTTEHAGHQPAAHCKANGNRRARTERNIGGHKDVVHDDMQRHERAKTAVRTRKEWRTSNPYSGSETEAEFGDLGAVSLSRCGKSWEDGDTKEEIDIAVTVATVSGAREANPSRMEPDDEGGKRETQCSSRDNFPLDTLDHRRNPYPGEFGSSDQSGKQFNTIQYGVAID
ncbi:hypothetical protein K402DRAFT_425142 [Aulographum hederae CBS 113979]|uniref:Uncharacterized protein n=1 Tax=Aulographum hederae CBS 113979 TaxID=1176131 RepID=A0A6G1GLK9_9PEZI|nr:hypothetical protein K402DRAFT_425142 [Aulographum hederae CBS 113979]